MTAREMKGNRRGIPIVWTLLSCLVAFLLAVGTAGQARAVEDEGRGPSPIAVDHAPFPSLAGHLEAFTDPEATLTIDDVAFGRAADRFAPVPGMYSGGYSRAAHWIRFAVTVPPQGWGEPLLLNINPPHLDDVRVFLPLTATPRTAGDYAVTAIGGEHPFTERTIPVSELLVPMELPPGATSIVYVRLSSMGTALLSPSLHTIGQAMKNVAGRGLVFGAVYGCAALIAVINFLFWLWLRERVYLLYSLFALTTAIVNMATNGTLFHLFPLSFHDYFRYTMGISICASVLTGSLFAVTILQARRFFPWIYRFSMAVNACAVLGVAAAVFRQWIVMAAPVFLSTLVLVVVFLYASIRLSLRGDAGGRLYLASFVPLIVVVGTMALRNIGVFESLPLGEYSMEIAIQTHLVMMTIGLASRIHLAEKERRQARQRALDVSRNAEREAKALVAERTRELVSAKTRLERTLAKEQQFSRQQVQFVDMISHEFRTPLTILHDAHTALSNTVPGVYPAAMPDLTRISRALGRLTEVLEVGLRRERIDTAKMRAKFVACDIRDLVREAVDTALSAHPHRMIRAEGLEAWSGRAVQGDFALLKTALVNLLDNAAKYSPDDCPIEIRVQSQVATVDSPDAIAIAVVDQGEGISEAQQQHVFEKFYRAPSSISKPGAGLGLHLVQRIVEVHGGTVSLATRQGSGTTALLVLPLHTPHDEAADADTEGQDDPVGPTPIGP